jgi:uncharacterized protein YodC (DUF2158 family)
MTGFCYPIGTRVRLASGGPDMLVVDMHPADAAVTCAWLNGRQVGEYRFPSLCLDIIRRHHDLSGKP